MSQLDLNSENRRKDLQALEHLNSLLADEHFTWFVEHVLAPAREKHRKDALSVTLEPAQAERARWQHAAVDCLCGEVARLHRDVTQRLRADER